MLKVKPKKLILNRVIKQEKNMTIRNPYACHPLLRKGGPHIKSRTGQRHQVKEKLMDEADEYMQDRLSHSDQDIILKAKNDDPDSFNQSKIEQDQGAEKPLFFNLSIISQPEFS